MTLPNIGLLGKMRSGKDTVAAYLAEKYGYTRFAFGDELKRYAHELFDEPAVGSKPRALYQAFGQACREIDPDIWVRKCLEAVDWNAEDRAAFSASLRKHAPHLLSSPFRAVITDCRQPNEYHALKSAGYTLIRVEAPEALRIHRAIESGDTFNLRDLTHDTETALDGFAADFTVMNDAGLPELYAQVDAIMDLLRSSSGGDVA